MESVVELPEPKLTLRQAMSQHVLEQGTEQQQKQLDTYLPEIVMYDLWAKLTMPGDRISFHSQSIAVTWSRGRAVMWSATRY
jgi:hypothetical protein